MLVFALNPLYNSSMKEYFNPTLGHLSLEQVAQEITRYIQADPESSYQLMVGTDSKGNGKIDFVTAIVIYRQGKGGRYFYKKFHQEKIIHLRHRIYTEVNASLETGQRLLKILRKYWTKKPKGLLEVHIDIGENGPTRELIKEVVGMVLCQGFQPKIKPYSYTASMVADRYA